MSSSDSELEDPHFKIPRGDSDEEIDSDEAAPSSDEEDMVLEDCDCRATINPGKEPDPLDQLGTHGVADTDSVTKAPLVAVAAKALKGGMLDDLESSYVDNDLPLSEDEEPCWDSASDDFEEHSTQYKELLNIATGRPDFAQRRNSRLQAVKSRERAAHVHTAPGEEGALKAQPKQSLKHEDALALMINELEGKGNNMGELKLKLNRVIGDERTARPLDTPLPSVVTARLQRSAAYAKTSEEISKWMPVVKKNRTANHLVFPLNQPLVPANRTSREVASGFKASNAFENEVHKLLKQAGVIDESEVIRVEEQHLDLAANEVSMDDILARRRELARLRSMMFLNDRKLKRIKKIKSRKYRKMLKLERNKIADAEQAAGLDEDEIRERVIAAERDRVEERMTLRHKNTSKWIRRQLTRGEIRHNPDARAAIEEQLRVHDELKKKQQNAASLAPVRSQSDTDEDESDCGDDQSAILDPIRADQDSSSRLMNLKFMQDAQKRRHLEALDLLNEINERAHDESETDDDTRNANDPSQPVPVVHGKGMRGALVGRRIFEGKDQRDDSKVVDQVPNDELETREGNESYLLSSCDVDDLEDRQDCKPLCRNYSSIGEAKQNTVRAEENTLVVTPSPGFLTVLDGRIEVDVGDPITSHPHLSHTVPEVHGSERNCLNEKSSHQCARLEQSGPNFVNCSRSSSANPWLIPVGCKDSIDESGQAKNSAENVTSSSAVLSCSTLVTDAVAEPLKKKARRAAAKTSLKQKSIEKPPIKPVESSPVEHKKEARASRGPLEKKISNNGSTSVTAGQFCTNTAELDRGQLELVARAFAGAGGADLADFKMAKELEVNRHLPTAESVGAKVLPGWGGWAGVQAPGSDKKGSRGSGSRTTADASSLETAFAKAAREKLEAARMAAVRNRADAKLPHVLITERRAKLASELTMSSVPFPFTNAEQWEKEVATPLLRERTTHAEMDKAVRPRVFARRGEALQPLDMSESLKMELAQMRRVKSIERGTTGVVKMRADRSSKRESRRRAFLA